MDSASPNCFADGGAGTLATAMGMESMREEGNRGPSADSSRASELATTVRLSDGSRSGCGISVELAAATNSAVAWAAWKLAADSETFVSISATDSWCSLGKTTISTVGGGNKPGSTTSASTSSKLKLKQSETDQGREDSMQRRNQVFPCSTANSSLMHVARGLVEFAPEEFEFGSRWSTVPPPFWL